MKMVSNDHRLFNAGINTHISTPVADSIDNFKSSLELCIDENVFVSNDGIY